MTDEHTVNSFKQKMESLVTMMTYTPTQSTWHILNHYLPCMDIPSYSYDPSESLHLCDRIAAILPKLNQLHRDDLFILKYKTAKWRVCMSKYTQAAVVNEPRTFTGSSSSDFSDDYNALMEMIDADSDTHEDEDYISNVSYEPIDLSLEPEWLADIIDDEIEPT